MKKSELLALLKRDIEDAANDLDLQARMVLARCISVGMLPPEAADFNIGNNWEPEWTVEYESSEQLRGVYTNLYRDNTAGTLTYEKLLTAKEKLSNIE